MDHQENPISTARRSLKRKLHLELQEEQQSLPKVLILDPDEAHRDLPAEVRAYVRVLESTFSFSEFNRAAAKRATHALCDLARDGKNKINFR